MNRKVSLNMQFEILQDVRAMLAENQTVSAELTLRLLVERQSDCAEAWLMLSDLATQRGDTLRARECVSKAVEAAPQNEAINLNIAHLKLNNGEIADGIVTLVNLLELFPKSFMAWMMLGDALALAKLDEFVVKARFQGLRCGQDAGFLMNMKSTPTILQPVIERIVSEVNEYHNFIMSAGIERMRNLVGITEMKRVEHAIAVHLGRSQDAPVNAHQSPKFLFFPGLPEGPYHDPRLHSWADVLVDAFDDIRNEAITVLQMENGLENFLSFKSGQNQTGYIGGLGRNPSWDAFFFYRHGEYYDTNHARCPKTSAALHNAELCEVDGQAPEVCFSVLQPGTHILPHYGVTNTRLVMHLPLIVPPECALNVFGGGVHVWRERELMMFDDTFQHEAWNKSDQARVILLMDCWNPHLNVAERIATRHLIELISAFENFTSQDLACIVRQVKDNLLT